MVIEADFDGDRRADCREELFMAFGGAHAVWLKVDGRWQVAPNAVANCVEAVPEELRAKLKQVGDSPEDDL